MSLNDIKQRAEAVKNAGGKEEYFKAQVANIMRQIAGYIGTSDTQATPESLNSLKQFITEVKADAASAVKNPNQVAQLNQILDLIYVMLTSRSWKPTMPYYRRARAIAMWCDGNEEMFKTFPLETQTALKSLNKITWTK